MKTKTKDMSVSRLRNEAYYAYLDGRLKRAKELNRLADQKEQKEGRQ